MITEHQVWSVVNRDTATVDPRFIATECVADVRLKWRADMVISLRVFWGSTAWAEFHSGDASWNW